MKRNSILIILIVLLFSCSSYKEEIKIKGDKYTAFENAIIDYSYTNKKYLKIYEVFEIVDKDMTNINSDAYNITILPRVNFFYLNLNDTLGAKSKNFPTNYKEYRGKLFVWNDKNKYINKDILNKLNSYNKLDSIRLKYRLGIYSKKDTIGQYPVVPIFKINEKIKGVNYYICSKKINIFYKYKSKFEINKAKKICGGNPR